MQQISNHPGSMPPVGVDPSTRAATDRRRDPRYALSLAITMSGENNFYTGLSENISESGVFIATQHLLPIGTPVVLSFTLPRSSEPISVTGIVQWVRGPDASARPGNNFGDSLGDAKPGMGVRFTGVDAPAASAIRAFMQLREPDFFE